MAEKKNEKPKYEVPRNEIPPQIRKSHFSSDEKNTSTILLGAVPPRERDKKNG